MKYKDIITGEEMEILTARKNVTKYELMQSAIRQTAQEWQNKVSESHMTYAELLHDIRIFEKYAKKYGLQREFKENGII